MVFKSFKDVYRSLFLLLLFISLLFTASCRSQAGNENTAKAVKKQWTKQWGTRGFDFVWSLSIEDSNSIYVAGDTSFGLDGKKNTGDNRDVFLVKVLK